MSYWTDNFPEDRLKALPWDAQAALAVTYLDLGVRRFGGRMSPRFRDAVARLGGELRLFLLGKANKRIAEKLGKQLLQMYQSAGDLSGEIGRASCREGGK